MFTSFWLEKPKMGPKKILFVFLLICITIFINKLLFTMLLVLTILFLSISVRKYGYNILIEELSINGQRQKIIDLINPWTHKHIRMICNDFGTVSAIDVANPKNNLYMSGIEKIINNDTPYIKFLHIGGGACSTPILLNHYNPTSSHVVLEIDAKMIAAATNFFLPFSMNKNIIQIRTDAKKYAFRKNEKYSYIIQDIFTKKTDNSDFFLTKKWISKIIKHLNKNGLLIINTSSKTQDTAINLALELKNIKEKIQIITIKRSYLVVIKK